MLTLLSYYVGVVFYLPSCIFNKAEQLIKSDLRNE